MRGVTDDHLKRPAPPDDHLQESSPSRTTTTTRVTMGHQDDRGDGTEGGGERVEGKIGADGTGSNCLQEVLADLIKKNNFL